jgi:phage-related protein
MTDDISHKRRWRFYRTAAGNEPVRFFLSALSQDDRDAVTIAMKAVEITGVSKSRHLRGDIYEVRASSSTQAFRILFATEGHYQQVLLALEAFSKKTQKTPHR